jgi:hypothetical protein
MQIKHIKGSSLFSGRRFDPSSLKLVRGIIVLIIVWATKSSGIYSKSPFGKGRLRGIFLINGPNDDQEQIMNAIC